MCGIAGVFSFKEDVSIDRGLIKKMCSALIHRGPDDEGIYCDNNIGLGHRRLSIIDLEGGRQPMSNEDGSVWIVFNGEIYNFLEIRADLIKKGHRFKTRCDTEVIVHLYEEEGAGCLGKLRGMFAFAIWDARDKTVFLARDRVGIKPLHYAVIGGRLIFASEIKAILEDPRVERRLDYEALHDYLSLMYVPAPGTMFKGIYKLPAGHYLKCGGEGPAIKEYWDIDFSKTTVQTEPQIREGLYQALRGSVGSHLISDVPIGAFLSGGIDSSSIVSIMSGLRQGHVITNSIGFRQKDYDELEYARLIAKRYSTDHHEYIVEPQAMEALDKLIWFYDEPFADASSIPTYYLSKMARQNVKVSLSGDGGDENFAGYDRYGYSNIIMKLQNAIPPVLKGAAEYFSRAAAGYGNALAIKIKNKLDEAYLPPFDIYFKIISIFREEEKGRLYSSAIKNNIKGYRTSEKFRAIFERCKSGDYISKLQYLDMKTYLCDDILTKVDRASMANSLEVRVPLLDHLFMEYVAAIPSSLKIRGASGKYIFKEAMARDIPGEILRRPKMGFAVPMTSWLRNELKEIVEEDIFLPGGIIRQLFDPAYVKNMWQTVLYSNMRGFRDTDFSYRIWLLFIFSRWFKKYGLNG
ncbi:MAG: asparagine synthase (glutamine-hydrolyzing) [Candidatus Omnitrophota bacterium]|jgi:asparagine synthase (glutamine-hydrolysing)